MSIDEADEIMNTYAKWDSHDARQNFLNRMGKKLDRKERFNR